MNVAHGRSGLGVPLAGGMLVIQYLLIMLAPGLVGRGRPDRAGGSRCLDHDRLAGVSVLH